MVGCELDGEMQKDPSPDATGDQAMQGTNTAVESSSASRSKPVHLEFPTDNFLANGGFEFSNRLDAIKQQGEHLKDFLSAQIEDLSCSESGFLSQAARDLSFELSPSKEVTLHSPLSLSGGNSLSQSRDFNSSDALNSHLVYADRKEDVGDEGLAYDDDFEDFDDDPFASNKIEREKSNDGIRCIYNMPNTNNGEDAILVCTCHSDLENQISELDCEESKTIHTGCTNQKFLKMQNERLEKIESTEEIELLAEQGIENKVSDHVASNASQVSARNATERSEEWALKLGATEIAADLEYEPHNSQLGHTSSDSDLMKQNPNTQVTDCGPDAMPQIGSTIELPEEIAREACGASFNDQGATTTADCWFPKAAQCEAGLDQENAAKTERTHLNLPQEERVSSRFIPEPSVSLDLPPHISEAGDIVYAERFEEDEDEPEEYADKNAIDGREDSTNEYEADLNGKIKSAIQSRSASGNPLQKTHNEDLNSTATFISNADHQCAAGILTDSVQRAAVLAVSQATMAPTEAYHETEAAQQSANQSKSGAVLSNPRSSISCKDTHSTAVVCASEHSEQLLSAVDVDEGRSAAHRKKMVCFLPEQLSVDLSSAGDINVPPSVPGDMPSAAASAQATVASLAAAAGLAQLEADWRRLRAPGSLRDRVARFAADELVRALVVELADAAVDAAHHAERLRAAHHESATARPRAGEPPRYLELREQEVRLREVRLLKMAEQIRREEMQRDRDAALRERGRELVRLRRAEEATAEAESAARVRQRRDMERATLCKVRQAAEEEARRRGAASRARWEEQRRGLLAFIGQRSLGEEEDRAEEVGRDSRLTFDRYACRESAVWFARPDPPPGPDRAGVPGGQRATGSSTHGAPALPRLPLKQISMAVERPAGRPPRASATLPVRSAPAGLEGQRKKLRGGAGGNGDVQGTIMGCGAGSRSNLVGQEHVAGSSGLMASIQGLRRLYGQPPRRSGAPRNWPAKAGSFAANRALRGRPVAVAAALADEYRRLGRRMCRAYAGDGPDHCDAPPAVPVVRMSDLLRALQRLGVGVEPAAMRLLALSDAVANGSGPHMGTECCETLDVPLSFAQFVDTGAYLASEAAKQYIEELGGRVYGADDLTRSRSVEPAEVLDTMKMWGRDGRQVDGTVSAMELRPRLIDHRCAFPPDALARHLHNLSGQNGGDEQEAAAELEELVREAEQIRLQRAAADAARHSIEGNGNNESTQSAQNALPVPAVIPGTPSADTVRSKNASTAECKSCTEANAADQPDSDSISQIDSKEIQNFHISPLPLVHHKETKADEPADIDPMITLSVSKVREEVQIMQSEILQPTAPVPVSEPDVMEDDSIQRVTDSEQHVTMTQNSTPLCYAQDIVFETSAEEQTAADLFLESKETIRNNSEGTVASGIEGDYCKVGDEQSSRVSKLEASESSAATCQNEELNQLLLPIMQVAPLIQNDKDETNDTAAHIDSEENSVATKTAPSSAPGFTNQSRPFGFRLPLARGARTSIGNKAEPPQQSLLSMDSELNSGGQVPDLVMAVPVPVSGPSDFPVRRRASRPF